MSTQLFRDGFQIERFYPETLGAFSDALVAMLHFGLPDHSADLEHHDCKHQLLNGVDGRFVQLFGGLERVRESLDRGDTKIY